MIYKHLIQKQYISKDLRITCTYIPNENMPADKRIHIHVYENCKLTFHRNLVVLNNYSHLTFDEFINVFMMHGSDILYRHYNWRLIAYDLYMQVYSVLFGI